MIFKITINIFIRLTLFLILAFCAGFPLNNNLVLYITFLLIIIIPIRYPVYRLFLHLGLGKFVIIGRMPGHVANETDVYN